MFFVSKKLSTLMLGNPKRRVRGFNRVPSVRNSWHVLQRNGINCYIYGCKIEPEYEFVTAGWLVYSYIDSSNDSERDRARRHIIGMRQRKREQEQPRVTHPAWESHLRREFFLPWRKSWINIRKSFIYFPFVPHFLILFSFEFTMCDLPFLW